MSSRSKGLLLSVFVAVFAALGFVNVSQSANEPPMRTQDPTELMVLVDPMATDIPTQPEGLITAIENGGELSRVELYARLGKPSKIRALTFDRLSDTTRDALPYSSPHRLLDSYVVLTYPNGEALLQAQKRLQQDRSIRWVRPSTILRFSAVPSDPLYGGVSSSPLDRQWGPTVLSLSAAWDQTPGTGYVGVLDNGILQSHPDLLSNYRPHFSGNFATTNPAHTADEIDGSMASFAGHGSHVAGIIAAVPNNSIGTAGVCWKCSLLVGKVSDWSGWGLIDSYVINGIVGLVRRGAQVLNMSFGKVAPSNYCAAPENQYDAYCAALATAVESDVVMVGAAGNAKSSVQFPASDPRVIAVGGIQVDGGLWDQLVSLPYSPARNNIPDAFFGQEIGSNFGTALALVAPARDILSTFYTGYDWNADFRCGSISSFSSPYIVGAIAPGFSLAQQAPYSRKYGVCTGTSMAAPHVAGIAGLLRSAGPLLSASSIRNILAQVASRANSRDNYWGYGVPNAAASLQSVLATNSRLTPLFVLYNPTQTDFLYTTVPQMAKAAIYGSMPPIVSGASLTYYTFSAYGNTISYYAGFPGALPVPKAPYSINNLLPRARIRVFTTARDGNGTQLVPIYRFSYSSPGVVRHVYAIGDADKAGISSVWNLDGIEGFVYPPNALVSGTLSLRRLVNPSTSSYVLVPSTDLSFWQGQGFVSDGSGVLGHAHPN